MSKFGENNINAIRSITRLDVGAKRKVYLRHLQGFLVPFFRLVILGQVEHEMVYASSSSSSS